MLLPNSLFLWLYFVLCQARSLGCGKNERMDRFTLLCAAAVFPLGWLEFGWIFCE